MNERFTSDLVFILVALLIAALLGFLIGYFWRRIKRASFLALENEKEQLRMKLEACIQQKEKQPQPFNAEAARAAFNMKIVENDLKIVEGIGEKIESLLKNRNITTWYQLSQTAPDKIKDILLTDGGANYNIHEPKTWPAQALLAHEGKWTELKDYQNKLTGGR